jgi:hypothetical protein
LVLTRIAEHSGKGFFIIDIPLVGCKPTSAALASIAEINFINGVNVPFIGDFHMAVYNVSTLENLVKVLVEVVAEFATPFQVAVFVEP